MKGWIVLAIIAGIIYYFYTETNKLDAPIADAQSMYQQAHDKLDEMTGTKITKIDNKLELLRADVAERLSKTERQALALITQSEDALDVFKDKYCGNKAAKHASLSKDNQTYLCDKLN